MWQVLYDELQDQGLEIVAVALDAGGVAATEASIRATDLRERPEVLAALMGWSPQQWARQAAPTFTCLIDEEHVVADLFGITNVPMAVWIDEDGRIVRPAEPAGATDNFRRLDPATFALPDDEVQRLQSNRRVYWDALRDWVANGARSAFALSPEEVAARLHRPGESDVRAAAHARIGRHLFALGDHDAAKRHFEHAVRLCPQKWNYRRQSMVLEPDLVGELNTAPEFFQATAALGTQAYYEPIDMPGIRQDPVVDAPPGAPPPP